MVEWKLVLNMHRESFSKLFIFCPLITSCTNMTFGTFNLFWVHDTWLRVDINTNNSTMSILIVLSSSLGLCESSPGSFDECRQSAKHLPTLRPSQPTWAVSLPVGCHHLHPPSPFISITHPEDWYSFYLPTEGRRLSRPMCSMLRWFTCVQMVIHPSINWVGLT